MAWDSYTIIKLNLTLEYYVVLEWCVHLRTILPCTFSEKATEPNNLLK